jgi:glycosyltransferase involved in cell wall biosynthesis
VRVLHVIDSLEPGGTERQCVFLARGLVGLGVTNSVWYFREGGLLAELTAAGVGARRIAVGSYRSPSFAREVLAMAREIRRWSPDVVQSYGYYSNLPALAAGFLARVPARIASRRDLGVYLSAGQRRLERWGWALAHRLVANSESVRRQLTTDEGVPAAKVAVIKNGVDLTGWNPAFRERPGYATEPTVGMVAHFRHQKDHRTFLQAAAQIAAAVPSVRFCLVGSGVLETETRAFARELGIADRVEFAGELKGDALRSAVARFSVSVLTSKHNEGMPNAVIESMALGLPVVATGVGGTTELIEDGITGFLVPPAVPAAVADRTVTLLKDPALAQRLGAHARLKVERELAMPVMVRHFHDLYRGLLPRAGASIEAKA